MNKQIAKEFEVKGQKFTLIDTPLFKCVRSKEYNYDFDKKTGYFARWGKTMQDDPQFSPAGFEIWDCEATTICSGMTSKVPQGHYSPCKFCYKANNLKGKNLSFTDFKTMIDKLSNRVLTQIAFGADSKAESNPDLFKMMQYCREVGVIPNITVSDVSDETIKKLCNVCGAVAVSRYEDKQVCYDIVRKLSEGGLSQVNIHSLLSLQTYDWCMETVKDIADGKVPGLNAIVFLSLKKKGRAKNNFDSVSYEQFKSLFLWCMENKISMGFDSCSASRFMKLVTEEDSIEKEIKKKYIQSCEPCESGLFSFYTNVDGDYFPCSFTEKENEWKNGLSLLNCNDFYEDIWYHPKNENWRQRLIQSGCKDNCRKCLTFPEIN